MWWRAAGVIVVALTWAATARGSPVYWPDDFGFYEYRYHTVADESEECPSSQPTPLEECTGQMALLCEADRYAAEAGRGYLWGLERALRRRGQHARADVIAARQPHAKVSPCEERGPPNAFGNLSCALEAIRRQVRQCDRSAEQTALREALVAAERLDEPFRTGSIAHIASQQAWLGYADEARQSLDRVLAQDKAILNAEFSRDVRRDWTPASVRRSIALTAAELGEFDLAVAMIAEGAIGRESVAPLIVQVALVQGRRDIALDLAKQLPKFLGKRRAISDGHAVIEAFLDHGTVSDAMSVVQSWPDADLEDIEHVAIGLARDNPAAALDFVVKRHPTYIASRLVQSAALAGNTDGALALLKGPHGIAAYRKWGKEEHLRVYPSAKAKWEHLTFYADASVPLAHAIAETAQALAGKGRRDKAFSLLRQAADLFADSEVVSRVGWATAAIAFTYARLGDPSGGLAVIMRSHKERAYPPKDDKERRERKARWMGELLEEQSFALAHRGDFRAALALLQTYPAYRKHILEGFVDGAARDPAAPPYDPFKR